jgi:hypothetical protein
MVADVDNEILKKVAKLGVLARKQGTIKLDFNRLLTDRSYANQLLSELEGSNDEDLVLLCLSLKVDFGILPATLDTRSIKFAESGPTRYIYSTRG